MRPFTLTVAKGTVSVPSPLKSMPSKTAIGWAAPSTMSNPCGLNTYEPRSVFGPQTLCQSRSARAVPEIAIVIARPSRLASELAEVRVPIILFISLFIFWFSFGFAWFRPVLTPRREKSCLAVHRCTERKPTRGYDETWELFQTKGNERQGRLYLVPYE